MNAIIKNFQTNLPETLYLGDQNFPVSISKSLILPLARTESKDNGTLIVTDDVNNLKIVQKYHGNKCTLSFYDLKNEQAELVVEYEAGKRVKPAISKAEPTGPIPAPTKQFSNGSPKMYAGKLKSDFEAAYADRDIKEKINALADMTPTEAVQEMSNVLTDCELPIEPMNVYDALTFFNVLVTPEEFYKIYEDVNSEKVDKDSKNAIEAFFRNYTINGTAKKMKRFSDKNVVVFTKQFSAIDCGDGDDATPDADEAIETSSDEMQAPEVIVAEECDTSNVDPESVKEHGALGLAAAGAALGGHFAKKGLKAKDNRDIGKMKAYKDMQNDKSKLAMEKEKTKQIKAQAKAKAASGEDEVAEGQCEDCAVENADDIKEHGIVGKALKTIGKTVAKHPVATAAAVTAGAIGTKKAVDAAKKKKAQEARGYNSVMKKAVGFSGYDECPECQVAENCGTDPEVVPEEASVSSFAAFDDLVRANQAAKAKKEADKAAWKERKYNDKRADKLAARELKEKHYQENRADNKEATAAWNKAHEDDVNYNRAIEARNYADSHAKLKADKARNSMALKFNKAQQKLLKEASAEDAVNVDPDENLVVDPATVTCPVCGNNPCTCEQKSDEVAAVKQHSYKNVYNYVK